MAVWGLGGDRAGDVDTQGHHVRDPGGDGNVTILFVMSYYSFARYYLRGKLSKGYMGSLYYFLQLYVNLQKSQIKVQLNDNNLSTVIMLQATK